MREEEVVLVRSHALMQAPHLHRQRCLDQAQDTRLAGLAQVEERSSDTDHEDQQRTDKEHASLQRN